MGEEACGATRRSLRKITGRRENRRTSRSCWTSTMSSKAGTRKAFQRQTLWRSSAWITWVKTSLRGGYCPVSDEKTKQKTDEATKKVVKEIKVDLDECIGCRACEMACSAFHARPRFSATNPARSRIRVVFDELNDVYVPTRAGDYTPAECTGRHKYVINGKEYNECSFCGVSCPARDYFKEPDSGLPLKCDMCEEDPTLEEHWCVKVCRFDCLTYAEREDSVKEVSEGTEILYFACCYQSYDPRLKKVAEATAKLLNQAGVDYGILGSKDSCCGESIRKTGSEEVFKRVARDNIKSFIDNGVQKILVSSPHCYETFKNEYPDFRANFEVVHISEFLLDLVQQGRLELKGEYGKKVAYHDPCYLGRHNGIYEAPRSLLQNVSGLELEEMKDSRADSLCCGGGGGRVWMETHKEDRFSDLRIQQAVDVGAEVLATSCPYCITMFEESRLGLDEDATPVIKDITEIIQEVT